MANYEYIKSFPTEEFAKIIVIEEQYDDMILYVASNGNKFIDSEGAIDENIEWLKSKKVNNSFLETYLCLRKN
jgi:hypothetical protein